MSNEVVHNGQPLLEVTSASQGMFGASGSGDTSGFGGLATVVPVPAPSERPYGSYFDVLADELIAALPDFDICLYDPEMDSIRLLTQISCFDWHLAEEKDNELVFKWFDGTQGGERIVHL